MLNFENKQEEESNDEEILEEDQEEEEEETIISKKYLSDYEFKYTIEMKDLLEKSPFIYNINTEICIKEECKTDSKIGYYYHIVDHSKIPRDLIYPLDSKKKCSYKGIMIDAEHITPFQAQEIPLIFQTIQIGLIFLWTKSQYISSWVDYFEFYDYHLIEHATLLYLDLNNKPININNHSNLVTSISKSNLLIFRGKYKNTKKCVVPRINIRHQRTPDFYATFFRIISNQYIYKPHEFFCQMLETLLFNEINNKFTDDYTTFMYFFAPLNFKRPRWTILVNNNFDFFKMKQTIIDCKQLYYQYDNFKYESIKCESSSQNKPILENYYKNQNNKIINTKDYNDYIEYLEYNIFCAITKLLIRFNITLIQLFQIKLNTNKSINHINYINNKIQHLKQFIGEYLFVTNYLNHPNNYYLIEWINQYGNDKLKKLLIQYNYFQSLKSNNNNNDDYDYDIIINCHENDPKKHLRIVRFFNEKLINIGFFLAREYKSFNNNKILDLKICPYKGYQNIMIVNYSNHLIIYDISYKGSYIHPLSIFDGTKYNTKNKLIQFDYVEWIKRNNDLYIISSDNYGCLYIISLLWSSLIYCYNQFNNSNNSFKLLKIHPKYYSHIIIIIDCNNILKYFDINLQQCLFELSDIIYINYNLIGNYCIIVFNECNNKYKIIEYEDISINNNNNDLNQNNLYQCNYTCQNDYGYRYEFQSYQTIVSPQCYKLQLNISKRFYLKIDNFWQKKTITNIFYVGNNNNNNNDIIIGINSDKHDFYYYTLYPQQQLIKQWSILVHGNSLGSCIFNINHLTTNNEIIYGIESGFIYIYNIKHFKFILRSKIKSFNLSPKNNFWQILKFDFIYDYDIYPQNYVGFVVCVDKRFYIWRNKYCI